MDTFSTIKHAPLRMFNRAVMLSNIYEDSGRAATEDYISNFTTQERQEIYDVLALVKKIGPEEVRKLATKDLVLQEDDE